MDTRLNRLKNNVKNNKLPACMFLIIVVLFIGLSVLITFMTGNLLFLITFVVFMIFFSYFILSGFKYLSESDNVTLMVKYSVNLFFIDILLFLLAISYQNNIFKAIISYFSLSMIVDVVTYSVKIYCSKKNYLGMGKKGK